MIIYFPEDPFDKEKYKRQLVDVGAVSVLCNMVEGVIGKEAHYSLLTGASISLDVNLQKLGLLLF